MEPAPPQKKKQDFLLQIIFAGPSLPNVRALDSCLQFELPTVCCISPLCFWSLKQKQYNEQHEPEMIFVRGSGLLCALT